MKDDVKKKAQEAIDAGGILLEDLDDATRVVLVVDPAHPELIFDRINELEISLVKSAGHNVQSVQNASDWADNLRNQVRQQLKTLGVEVTQ